MYGTTGIVGTSAIGTGGLAATGMNFSWALLAGFALLGAGLALMRLAPKRRSE
jgi:hypothetical protein